MKTLDVEFLMKYFLRKIFLLRFIILINLRLLIVYIYHYTYWNNFQITNKYFGKSIKENRYRNFTFFLDTKNHRGWKRFNFYDWQIVIYLFIKFLTSSYIMNKNGNICSIYCTTAAVLINKTFLVFTQK